MNLTTEQAEELAKEPKTFSWMEMLRVQPPEGYILRKTHSNFHLALFREPNPPLFSTPGRCKIKLPHQIGTVVEMREKFGYVWPDDCEDGRIYDNDHWNGRPITRDEMNVIYYADDPDFIWWSDDTDDNECKMWLSSTQMPKKLIRRHYTVTGLRVCQVGELTPFDVDSMGLLNKKQPEHKYGLDFKIAMDTFKQWFNDRYSKPRPRRKNGEIVSWECWAWDEWAKELNSNRNLTWGTKGILWKRLPLIANINPWICICEGGLQ